ncbi:TPA: hypothetical protein ACR3Z0_006136 [Bacillus thuringiensis]|uniref:PXO1-73 n=6 Tax=Bacillus cereus group TaxID=86661 RepID=A0A9X6K9C7_BACTU|nr:MULTISPECIES: hypothetical protein [Bacillus]AEA19450.1 hypothetical protein CT43_P281108 [Bacillus thuringiensis serovar chinensis CT-43]AGG05153.1 pXO1-73 [Bacillus thuringiensis serovar thuringiensis str. IS5056]AHZ54829.1 hypothetical protein YBT1520_31656 [Bacillus thuringiensis serovar kurstaki str. YBT-1520]AIE37274.1 hypothetical protein BTK_31691 [Bacillus thuringiensis serovar kurstaki str. HD-1]AIM34562.1 hypothetical protein DF16_pBMB293orf00038 [Bacillus thuringiensis serovar k
MGDLIGDIFGGILMSIPSKKEKMIRKNFKLLKNETWFKEIEQRYGRLMLFNHSIREFVKKEDLEAILKDVKKTNEFRYELEGILKQEKI